MVSRRLRSLRSKYWLREDGPVEDYDDCDDASDRDCATPVCDDEVAGDDFEWNEGSFKDEEIVACRNAEGFIDISACKTDEGRGDWKVCHHFGHA